jgi:biotin operon repressor
VNNYSFITQIQSTASSNRDSVQVISKRLQMVEETVKSDISSLRDITNSQSK